MAEHILRDHTVYGLCDSRNGEIRYIGQTSTSLRRRLICHISESRSGTDPKSQWIREVRAGGGSIQIIVLVERAEKDVEEIIQIEAHEKLGHSLLNLTGGGSGLMNCRDSTRAKMAASASSRFSSQEERDRTSALTKAAMARPGISEAISAANKRRFEDPAEREKQSARTSATYADPAMRAAQSARRAKMSDAQVIEARMMRKSGSSLAELCKRFGLAAGPMSMLCNGKTFKHLPMP
ncbi:hypothetical protein [Pseudomonas aeruginosa]|uniref:hypothetical protein n=1 Tax=Pseudomonas aeruginosa TaxID=287 RepID=UPI00071BE68A|nr:hypothetical protein [Pseudomonas aeruginosa]KSJ42381.2 hypothetical protein APA00_32730 [Pseudomonas aeruginosa]